MARIQCNLKLPPELVARLREEASAAGLTLTALAERKLAAPLVPVPVAEEVSAPVVDRLAALEARVAALEAKGSAALPDRLPDRLPGAASLPLEGKRSAASCEPGDRLTTSELARLLGVSRSALLNWVARNSPGSIRDGWRLVGKQRSATGGPDRLVWEKCSMG